ncbi:ATP-dependent endonuclease [Methanosarcina sp. WH1]|uniref:ATP-dependent nuclease n=1 Tax=Methanosarcina sp. WH1 TaxID=1434102 RepID=UPI000615AB76|nr:ATP-binding protein [Methanosarcina sp. WH1]AKB22331.1 hypothetical protein MSWH1_2060 [Methanosarcina sp. WH1]
MQHLIKEVKLLDENYSFLNNSETSENRIRFLSKLNIFVGENNSGKSRLLRSLLSNELDYVPDSSFIEDYNTFVENLKNEFESYFQKKKIDIKGFINLYKTLDEIKNIESINKSMNLNEKLSKLEQNIQQLENQGNIFSEGVSHTTIAQNLFQIFRVKTCIFGENLEQSLKLPEFQKIYIPILRGTKPIKYTESEGFQYADFYGTRIRKDYFTDEVSNKIEVFTGSTSYNEIKRFLLGNLKERKLIAGYEKYLSENFFDNKPIALIPSQSNGVITVKVGDETERPIYEVGDGIESIIILTMPLFLNKGKSLLVFIEEPEKLLHPGLQRKLIETLLCEEGFENYQYFITTHSNHLLDITFDFSKISVYTLRKKLDDGTHDEKDPKFSIENLSQGDRSALELLGVRNSSVFLSNCTIWVEGITDRLYFRHYLKLYLEYMKNKGEDFAEFKEDFHYSFVEYGGGNITHWSFLDKEDHPINVEKLCGKLFLITDKDKNKDGRHEKLEKELGVRFYCLECKEVENLLSKKVLLEVVKDYEKADPIIEDFEESDYKNVYLGKFIDDKLGADKKRTASYADKSGTVSDKSGFCLRARKYITEWDDLSNEAKGICERIYQFIKENNG